MILRGFHTGFCVSKFCEFYKYSSNTCFDWLNYFDPVSGSQYVLERCGSRIQMTDPEPTGIHHAPFCSFFDYGNFSLTRTILGICFLHSCIFIAFDPQKIPLQLIYYLNFTGNRRDTQKVNGHI